MPTSPGSDVVVDEAMRYGSWPRSLSGAGEGQKIGDCPSASYRADGVLQYYQDTSQNMIQECSP